MKLQFSQQIFEKYSNIRLHKNPFSGSRVVPRGQTDGQTHRQTDRQTDRQTHTHTEANRRTDMTKLIVDFSNFANSPKIVTEFQCAS